MALLIVHNKDLVFQNLQVQNYVHFKRIKCLHCTCLIFSPSAPAVILFYKYISMGIYNAKYFVDGGG